MSKRDGKMYVAMRIFKEAHTSMGLPVKVDDDDVAGCMWVFWTKKAAREVYGKDVVLFEVGLEDDNE